MQVIFGLENLTTGKRPRVIGVGAFDGFHLGHQYLLQRVCTLAQERNLESGIVTFEPVPAQFFATDKDVPRRLITCEERIALAEALCCDFMAVLEFNADLASWPAERFIRAVLAEALHTRLLVASATHTMGRDRADIAQITQLCEPLGIEVVRLPIMQLEGLRISSSAIREALWAGRIEEANTMLGRHYSLAGPVVAGRGVGRQLGFPTANIQPPPEKLIPKEGVYAGIAVWQTGLNCTKPMSWPAAISIGTAPTFQHNERLIEAHLLGENIPQLVGETLRLEFVSFLREQQKFADAAALAAQIAHDVQRVRKLCTGANAAIACDKFVEA